MHTLIHLNFSEKCSMQDLSLVELLKALGIRTIAGMCECVEITLGKGQSTLSNLRDLDFTYILTASSKSQSVLLTCVSPYTYEQAILIDLKSL